VRSARDAADGVRVAVKDSGPGPDPKSLDRLFEAFYTTKTDGLGLGLAISRRIVEAHGGSIGLHETPGGGTTFRVTLPVRPSVTVQDGADRNDASTAAIAPVQSTDAA
jgi:signal transduction histidine kinase